MRTIRNLTMMIDHSRLNLSADNIGRDAMVRISLETGDGRSGSILLTHEEAAAVARAITLYFNEAKV